MKLRKQRSRSKSYKGTIGGSYSGTYGLIFALSLLLCSFISGCTGRSSGGQEVVVQRDPGSPEDLEKLHGKRVSYILKRYKPIVVHDFLPKKTKTEVIWIYEDGYEAIFPAFNGWDIDKDGRVDSLDVLNWKGEVETRAFDFDGDGKIDEVNHQR